MLPMRFFRDRAFTAVNLAALGMYAAVFGGLFVVTQLLQSGLGGSPLAAGLRTLPMVAMPVLLVPVGGVLSDRLGARPLMITAVVLEAVALGWLAAAVSPDVEYLALLPPLILMGAGSALFFAPMAATVVGSVAVAEHGRASGVAMALRELAVVVGVALLSAVFAAHGDVGSSERVVAGSGPALWVAAALAAVAGLAALALPGPSGWNRRRPTTAADRSAAMVQRWTSGSAAARTAGRAGGSPVGRCWGGLRTRVGGAGVRRGRDRQDQPRPHVPQHAR
jgi:MFS family permease